MILFRQWFKISWLTILLQCSECDRVSGVPVRLNPEKGITMNFFIWAN